MSAVILQFPKSPIHTDKNTRDSHGVGGTVLALTSRLQKTNLRALSSRLSGVKKVIHKYSPKHAEDFHRSCATVDLTRVWKAVAFCALHGDSFGVYRFFSGEETVWFEKAYENILGTPSSRTVRVQLAQQLFECSHVPNDIVSRAFEVLCFGVETTLAHPIEVENAAFFFLDSALSLNVRPRIRSERAVRLAEGCISQGEFLEYGM